MRGYRAGPLDDMPLHQFGQGGAVFRPGPAAVVDAGPGIGALESVEGAEPLEAVGLGVQRVGEFEVAAGGAAVGASRTSAG